MVNWELLYKKYGQKKAGEKFEDMALEYVRDTYSEYTWKPTGRTRDGNRDFHNLEDKLLNIWGEAKYKKDSISLTRKDLDPTILSGLIDGSVELIIFVTNGKIPDSLITRMTLGANMKGFKISFVTGKQLSDWLVLNESKYEIYFGEKLENMEINTEPLIDFRKVSFYEPISLDFKPNYDKVSMNVDDTFIMNCLIFNSETSICEIKLENQAPLSFLDSEKYESPKSFKLKPGLNAISFLVRANNEYKNVLRIELICNNNTYHCISNKLVINKNNQLNIYYFQQLDVLNKIKHVIDNFDISIGNYTFFIHGYSGMGKSYILKQLSLDYCLNNDLTLVTFESEQGSSINYLLLCRIIIFLQYGNIFWNHDEVQIKKFCRAFSNLIADIDANLLNDLLNGCFDANIAKVTIEHMIHTEGSFPLIINSKQQKNFRILLLDDIQYLTTIQSSLLEILINQQLKSNNNNILVLSGRKNEFNSSLLEKKLMESISNYYELNKLSEKDIEGTILQNFNIKEKLGISIINELPSNLLLLNEVLSNLKYSLKQNNEITNSQFINYYIELYSNGLVFQEKFSELKEKYYLLDILYLFKKGININNLYTFPDFDKSVIKKDLQILRNCNCIKQVGRNIIFPLHDYLVENYRNLRKGKEYNEKTGNFIKFLLNTKKKEVDTNYLLSIICKCGKKYFKDYNATVQKLMLQYIHKSEYGIAVVFAELFYKNTINKKRLTPKDKYFLYLYADCLVHCDNKYRAKELLQKIADNEDFTNFEKYEAAISLLNQRFWTMDIKGIIEDSKMYQTDLENMFMDFLDSAMLKRFKKAYEACFNRRMVTLLLLDKYYEAQKTYQDGLVALKAFSEKYNLNYDSEIATIAMDYARGNMTRNPQMSYKLFSCALKKFNDDKNNYIRRFLICQLDLEVVKNILKEKTDYKQFMYWVEELNKHNFLPEYIKGVLKLYACRMVDYSRSNIDTKISVSFMADIVNKIEKIKVEKHKILNNRELYLYNYLIAYFYIVQCDYEKAKTCIKDNIGYVTEAGNTYKIPLEHNLTNLENIQNVEWYLEKSVYSEKIYLLDSRFW